MEEHGRNLPQQVNIYQYKRRNPMNISDGLLRPKKKRAVDRQEFSRNYVIKGQQIDQTLFLGFDRIQDN